MCRCNGCRRLEEIPFSFLYQSGQNRGLTNSRAPAPNTGRFPFPFPNLTPFYSNMQTNHTSQIVVGNPFHNKHGKVKSANSNIGLNFSPYSSVQIQKETSFPVQNDNPLDLSIQPKENDWNIRSVCASSSVQSLNFQRDKETETPYSKAQAECLHLDSRVIPISSLENSSQLHSISIWETEKDRETNTDISFSIKEMLKDKRNSDSNNQTLCSPSQGLFSIKFLFIILFVFKD